MINKHNEQKDTQNVLQWMASNRLYESYLFVYILILSAWVILGLFTFGFEINGYTLKENLAFNFAYFGLLAFFAALTPQLHRLIWGKNAGFEQRRAEIEAKAQAIADKQLREAVFHHLESDGGLPPNHWQVRALIFLAWYFLFELFFISAWVKDLSLVWQPAWVDGIIDWVRNNTTITSRFTTDSLFTVGFGGHGDSEFEKIAAKMFSNDEQAFLNSPFGDVALLFHFLRAITFIPMVAAWIIIFWQWLGWTGMNRLNPSHIGSVKSFLWLAFISFFMVLLMMSISAVFVEDIGFKVGMVINKVTWMRSFWMNACFIFILIGLSLSIGWLFFWKNVLIKLYGRIIK